MTSTPWGASQTSKQWARGIMQYSTAGHGGFHLSKSRNERMPDALRIDDGWYEEDCEWAFVALAFPDVFAEPDRDIPAMAERSIKQSYPDRWEAWTGVKVTAAESHLVREREFLAAHTDDWLSGAARGSWAEGVIDGTVGVVAYLGGDHSGDERWFLVPEDEYDKRDGLSLVIDLDRHTETGPDFGPLDANAEPTHGTTKEVRI